MSLKTQVGNARAIQYRHGIYTHSSEQASVAQKNIATLQKQMPNSQIMTELEPCKIFWPAEEYHQQYLQKGGRFKQGQSAEKGSTEEIRCYG
mmetsp:Transcript_1578/g.3927  ORF Transcript_1578/g.3927 Transcript_1578/m.3927 type:complete len:92 (-) Transcript_1578:162-437(-)